MEAARPAGEPATQRAVRRHNLGIVLRHLADHRPRSRATIALETGFNKSTVSSLVGELIDLGLLLERATAKDGRARLALGGAAGRGVDARPRGGGARCGRPVARRVFADPESVGELLPGATDPGA